MNDETKTPEPTVKEDRRKAREEHLVHLRTARRMFQASPSASRDGYAARLQKAGPQDASREIEDLWYQNVALHSAQARLYEHLLWLIQERDALETAYREEKAERDALETAYREEKAARESAEMRREIAEAVLSARYGEIAELEARLRERKRKAR